MADSMFSKAMAAPKKGGRFRIGISWGSTTNSLDPATYLDNYMFTVGLTIGSLLAQVDPKGNIDTDLAESFEPSNGRQGLGSQASQGSDVPQWQGRDCCRRHRFDTPSHGRRLKVGSEVRCCTDRRHKAGWRSGDLHPQGRQCRLSLCSERTAASDHASKGQWRGRLGIRNWDRSIRAREIRTR